MLYTDLSSQDFDWKVITPPQAVLSDLVPPPKDIGSPYDVRPSNVIAIGNRILANIVLLVQGSGQFTNGHLYSSEDLGKSWSKVDLDMPEEVVKDIEERHRLKANYPFNEQTLNDDNENLKDLVKHFILGSDKGSYNTFPLV